MAKKTEVPEDTRTPVYFTVDTDGGWWWATRDADGELTASEGTYPDESMARERASVALGLAQSEIVFSTEEDQRTEAPA